MPKGERSVAYKSFVFNEERDSFNCLKSCIQAKLADLSQGGGFRPLAAWRNCFTAALDEYETSVQSRTMNSDNEHLERVRYRLPRS
jgi:hypothetical protein